MRLHSAGEMIAVGLTGCPERFLAQSDPSAAAFEGLVLLGGVVGVMMVVLLVAGRIRKRLSRTDSSTQPPFSLDAIRRMRDNGELSESEYASLRQRIIDRAVR